MRSVYYRGLLVSGTIRTGDWEGDPSVPGGIHYLPAYADDITVYSQDMDDITDMLTDDALIECETAILEAEDVGEDAEMGCKIYGGDGCLACMTQDIARGTLTKLKEDGE